MQTVRQQRKCETRSCVNKVCHGFVSGEAGCVAVHTSTRGGACLMRGVAAGQSVTVGRVFRVYLEVAVHGAKLAA